ncbi:MAG: hypothetical protein IJN42_01880 [Clostridia bacterium]|nr:hypothetical protein [Clostridia bacterium]
MDKEVLLEHLVRSLLNTNTPEAEKEKAMTLYLNQLSSDISVAVGSLSDFNAALVVGMLETYADTIRKDFKCRDGVIDGIKQLQKERIMVSIPKRRGDEK